MNILKKIISGVTCNNMDYLSAVSELLKMSEDHKENIDRTHNLSMTYSGGIIEVLKKIDWNEKIIPWKQANYNITSGTHTDMIFDLDKEIINLSTRLMKFKSSDKSRILKFIHERRNYSIEELFGLL